MTDKPAGATVKNDELAKQGGSKKTKKAPGKSAGSGPGTRTFPPNTLEAAIAVAQAVEERHAGHPMQASEIVKAVGFRQVNDWRFLNLLRSANAYGLVEGAGQKATVKLLPLGEDIVAPDSAAKRQAALLKAFRNVENFREVEKFYEGKRIPEDEYFANTLTRQFKIPRDRVSEFISVFVSNLEYLKAFAASEDGKVVRSSSQGTAADTEKGDGAGQEQQIRQFLDSCFVMMPFGEWFDTYYESIYVPAIKDAGFEPIRADEIFNAGSVVEQVWERIVKAKVLLADLTGKNANVFYELGLAHAARKPVVLTAGSLDDVPFDLRHLRVIIYEVRQPDWAAQLRKSVTAYLKNAKAEPEKSIPQPFRDEPESGAPPETNGD